MMILLLVIIGVIILVLTVLICFVLIVPINVTVDTDKKLYMIRQPGLFSVCLVPTREFSPEVRIVGIKLPVKIKNERQVGEHPKERGETREKKKTKRSLDAWRFLLKKVVRSVVVRKFEIDVDTDDFPLNAKLVPLFYFASRGPCVLNVNFSGRNYLGLLARVRPISVVWAYLLFLTKQ